MGDHLKAEDFIKHIPGSGGIISTIASRVGCAWHTAKKYIEKYPTIGQAYDDEVERTVDVAEAVVLKALQDNDVVTAKWFLTMKGSGRGYVPRQDVTSGGEKIVLTFTGNVDPEEL
jgi:hypothetical protein